MRIVALSRFIQPPKLIGVLPSYKPSVIVYAADGDAAEAEEAPKEAPKKRASRVKRATGEKKAAEKKVVVDEVLKLDWAALYAPPVPAKAPSEQPAENGSSQRQEAKGESNKGDAATAESTKVESTTADAAKAEPSTDDKAASTEEEPKKKGGRPASSKSGKNELGFAMDLKQTSEAEVSVEDRRRLRRAETNAFALGNMSDEDRARIQSVYGVSIEELLARNPGMTLLRALEEEDPSPNFGALGAGEMETYCIITNEGMEKKVGAYLEGQTLYMPTVMGPGGEKLPRIIRCTVVEKKQEYFNPLTEKQAVKTIKMDLQGNMTGGVLLVDCVLDNDLYNIIDSSPVVVGFAHRELVGVHSIPVPIPEAFRDTIADFQAKDFGADISEELADSRRALRERAEGDDSTGKASIRFAKRNVDTARRSADFKRKQFKERGVDYYKEEREDRTMRRREADVEAGLDSRWYTGEEADAAAPASPSYGRASYDRPYGRREDRSYERRDDRPYERRDDRPYERRDDRPYERRDRGDRPYERRDREERPWEDRGEDRSMSDFRDKARSVLNRQRNRGADSNGSSERSWDEGTERRPRRNFDDARPRDSAVPRRREYRTGGSFDDRDARDRSFDRRSDGEGYGRDRPAANRNGWYGGEDVEEGMAMGSRSLDRQPRRKAPVPQPDLDDFDGLFDNEAHFTSNTDLKPKGRGAMDI